MTNTLEIKLLSDNATKPKRADDESAGYDIYAAETVILEPQQKTLIATDLAVNIPKGYVGLLTSRSGVSSKTQLVVETGKIDAGFQGHMKINVKNDSRDWYGTKHSERLLDIQNEEIMGSGGYAPYQIQYQINKGDRLAQLVIVPIWTPELETVEEFESETARGQNGFGSSGTR
ncbi:dUTP pyrophosphatase [Staphylococcus equorum]|uniref:dUTP diphosphatase n=1 Tax=Staphylococcus equorum TaxID=246432 RepID=UPI0008FB8228|nr:dUTP pyrophosphatase [Staphylococcus equorum]OIS52051.1 dUTP pyrophosphatase [Staphylococcus equorum]